MRSRGLSLPFAVTALSMAVLASPAVLHAQSGTVFTDIGAGWTFPSGGDWSDTYGPGPHATIGLGYDLTQRWSLRADLMGASYVAQAFHGHPKGDRAGKTLSLTVVADYVPPVLQDHLYLLAGAGLYFVSGTWLTAVNTIDPYITQTELGAVQGIGAKISDHSFVEIRHHIAFRPSRNWARFIPVTLGFRF